MPFEEIKMYTPEKLKQILANECRSPYTSEVNLFMNYPLGGVSLVPEQTMHQVFRVEAIDGNFYVKIGKESDKDKGEREMKTEAFWYERMRSLFPQAPEARYVQLADGAHILAVKEVSGTTCDKLLKAANDEEKRKLMLELITISVRTSVEGYKLHLKNPEGTPAFFGEFNEDEFDFLTNRTLKILRANGMKDGLAEKTKEALGACKLDLAISENWSFYRDATPLNWIKTPSGEIVPIDMGSTSYRPVQFELVALIETPGTGLDDASEQFRDLLRDVYGATYNLLKNRGSFETIFWQASFVKNLSGVASRIDHVNKNRRNLESTIKDSAIEEARLEANQAGMKFHARRASIAALDILGMKDISWEKHHSSLKKVNDYLLTFF